MDILNDPNWERRDWDNLNVETVEAIATDALSQVRELLDDPKSTFDAEQSKKWIERLELLAWACQKNKRGLFHRTFLGAIDEIKRRRRK